MGVSTIRLRSLGLDLCLGAETLLRALPQRSRPRGMAVSRIWLEGLFPGRKWAPEVGKAAEKNRGRVSKPLGRCSESDGTWLKFRFKWKPEPRGWEGNWKGGVGLIGQGADAMQFLAGGWAWSGGGMAVGAGLRHSSTWHIFPSSNGRDCPHSLSSSGMPKSRATAPCLGGWGQGRQQEKSEVKFSSKGNRTD